MTQIYGIFREDLPQGTEYLILRFSPSSIPLQKRWRNNGLSADFMADYMATFFPGESMDPVKSAVSFIANELIENAMKYHTYSSDQPITISLLLYSDRLVFLTTNQIDATSAEPFQVFLNRLTTADPADLLLEQLESNAAEEQNTHSGLGFLTMMNDYQAELGWKFEGVPEMPEIMAVTTMVQLLSETL